uniref:Secreted protein n=1 Tax=Romanomermis culicivorax TaxID=13658 RepID=A0A915IPB3_ROMCU
MIKLLCVIIVAIIFTSKISSFPPPKFAKRASIISGTPFANKRCSGGGSGMMMMGGGGGFGKRHAPKIDRDKRCAMMHGYQKRIRAVTPKDVTFSFTVEICVQQRKMKSVHLSMMSH